MWSFWVIYIFLFPGSLFSLSLLCSSRLYGTHHYLMLCLILHKLIYSSARSKKNLQVIWIKFLDTNQIILGKGGGEQKRMVQMYIDTCTCNFSSFIGDGVGWDTLYFFALQWFKKPIATCNIPLNRKTYTFAWSNWTWCFQMMRIKVICCQVLWNFCRTLTPNQVWSPTTRKMNFLYPNL